ncbi:MAG: hypothetical protein IPM22_05685 [Betaproteobacteria bacterium]|nr:hypothetical protein [Betaproteobacteria bacterium]
MTGPLDRGGPVEASWAIWWSAAHPSRGRDPAGLMSATGDGLFHCCAAK